MGSLNAQRPDAPEFAQKGPYTVGTQEFTIENEARPLNVAVWYPAENPDNVDEHTTYTYSFATEIEGHAIRDARVNASDAPYPLIVFSHGSGGYRYQSLFLNEHLASFGFIVMAVDHPTNTVIDSLESDTFTDNLAKNFAYRPQDIIRVINFAESLSTSESPFTGLIDTDRVGVAGHSFGGFTSLAVSGAQLNFDQLESKCTTELLSPNFSDDVCFLLGQENTIATASGLDTTPDGAWSPGADPRIRATVALAPWNGPVLDTSSLSTIETPTLVIIGTGDEIAPAARDAYVIYDALFNSTPKALVSLENAGHYVFVDQCFPLAIDLGFFDKCSDPIWDMERAHDLINHFTTAFFRAILYNDQDAMATLESGTVEFPGVQYEIATEQVETLVPELVSVRNHDPSSYTQGLLLYDGLFYESAGQYGASTLREVNPETGEVIRIVNLRDDLFAEGLARVDDHLFQLTWRENIAIEFNLATFEPIGFFQYEGEGWGLCYDGEYLYMSNGSSMLTKRNPETFQVVETIPVLMRGDPIDQLNELECVNDSIYANIWKTNYIVQIDKETGHVIARIDASNLLTDEERAQLDSSAVLNGIAYDEDNGVFLITGKYWPKLFEVQFVTP
jgi:glutaminyl-peptide cyclotransferase